MHWQYVTKGFNVVGFNVVGFNNIGWDVGMELRISDDWKKKGMAIIIERKHTQICHIQFVQKSSCMSYLHCWFGRGSSTKGCDR